MPPPVPPSMNPANKQATEKSGGLFSSKPKPTGPSSEFISLTKDITNLNRRLRVLEERYTNLRKKTQVTDQNMLNNNQKINRHIQLIHEDMRELRLEITDIKNKLTLMVKELQMLAKKEELDVLKKYIEMWNPLNFITAKEAESIIDSMIDSRLNDINFRVEQENFIREQIQNNLKEIIDEEIKKVLTQLIKKKKK